MTITAKQYRILFFLAWFILNLVQASNTGLFHDEAYYWVYSLHLDWGYFDHPPMIAVLIRLGYYLFDNELGVRLLTVVLNTLSLMIIYHLLPRKNDRLFYAIACSFAVLQVGGIIAVPDLPLAFFVALFFLAYRKFLYNMGWLQTLFLGVVMALMLYSKYHGVLIILFTVLSNPKLLLKPRFYLAAFTGALLFIPHLLWQYNHGFPSVEYHLFERNAPAYRFAYTTEYILGQVVLPGPLMGWLFLWAAFKYKSRDAFEKALKFSMAGVYVFFLVSTLKGRVEANWTVPVFIPLIVLSHQYLSDKARWQAILRRTVPFTLLLVALVRVYMMLDIAPLKILKKGEFHKNQPWADSIYTATGGMPVVFINSYQRASKYWFYAGIPAFSLNTDTYRRNNYNFLPMEDSFYNKKIALITGYDAAIHSDSITTPLGVFGMRVIDSFYSFSKVKITTGKNLEAVDGIIKNCTLEIAANDNHLAAFKTKRFAGKDVMLTVMDRDDVRARVSVNIPLSTIKERKETFVTSFRVDLPKGRYSARYVLPTSMESDYSLNSRTINLLVE